MHRLIILAVLLLALSTATATAATPPGPMFCHRTNDPNWTPPPGCFHHPSVRGIVTR